MIKQAVGAIDGVGDMDGLHSAQGMDMVPDHSGAPRSSRKSETRYFITLGAISFIFTLLLLRKLIPDY